MLSWIREKFGKAIITGIIVVIAMVFVFYGVFSPKNTRGIHEGAVAGTVNGDTITMAEFQRAFNRQVEFYQQMMGGQKLSEDQLKMFGVKKTVFQGLVRRKIMAQKAEKQGIISSDEEIRDQIRDIPAFQANGKFDGNTYRQVLEANSLTPAAFEQQIRDDLAVQRFSNYFRDRVNASDDEVKVQFLNANDKRNIKYVLLTAEAGKKDVKVDPAEVQKYLADSSKLNLAKSQFESKKDKEFKGKTFDSVKEEIAKDSIALSKFDEIKKANDKVAQEILPLLKADKGSDAQINKILKPYGVEVKQTGFVTRENPYLPGLGSAKDLIADAFADKSPIDPSQGGKAKRYDSATWVAVAVISDAQHPDLAKLEAQRPTVMKEIIARKERDLFESWMKRVEKDSRIDSNPAVVGDAAPGGDES